MAPPKKSIKELSDKCKHYSLKVKVIGKTRPQESPKKTKYQQIRMKDEHGDEIGVVSYGDNIDLYNKTILYQREFEISNAIIKLVKESIRRRREQIELEFGQHTVIRPLSTASEGTSLPNYVPIATIRRVVSSEDHYDVVGVVLFLSDVQFKKWADAGSRRKRGVPVREIVLVDPSCKGTNCLLISAWNDLPTNACDVLSKLVDTLPVVAIPTLKPSLYKGFSLSSTRSTNILFDPEGEEARAVTKWHVDSKDASLALKNNVTECREGKDEVSCKTISELKAFKVEHVLPDTCFWLTGQIREFLPTMLYLYLGRDKCSKKTDARQGSSFQCEKISCRNQQSVAVPGMRLAFELVDATISLNFAAFTNDAAVLLGCELDSLFNMPDKEREAFYTHLEERLPKKVYNINVGLNTQFTFNKSLKWVLRSVEATNAC